MTTDWPVRLVDGEVTAAAAGHRPTPTPGAGPASATRRGWCPWDATVPPGGEARPTSFKSLVRRLSKQARQGTTFPFAIEVDGRFAGQVTVNNIVRGSAMFASVGYWLDQDFAGRGVMPRAVAMVIDHCFITAGLHRVEIAIRPENSNSLRVVEKLEIREIGYAPKYLHIDGAWRDHRIYAVTKEEVPEGCWPGCKASGQPRTPIVTPAFLRHTG